MIRSFLIEIGLFILPFAVYAIALMIMRRRVTRRQSWPMRHVGLLSVVAALLVIASLIYLAHFSGSPPGSTYTPAHVEDGRFVPGTAK